MTRLQFLCVNHRRWIRDNPDVAARTWMQAYSRGVELLDEYRYARAARHAGAAYETADIMLTQASPPGAVDLRRFCDSGLLLIQSLYLLGEAQLAATIMASALGRLDGLLHAGCDRRSILSGCQRLQQFAECPPGDKLPGERPAPATVATASSHVH